MTSVRVIKGRAAECRLKILESSSRTVALSSLPKAVAILATLSHFLRPPELPAIFTAQSSNIDPLADGHKPRDLADRVQLFLFCEA